MERQERKRNIVRKSIDEKIEIISGEFQKENPSRTVISINMDILEKYEKTLLELDEAILDYILKEELTSEVIESERVRTNTYVYKITEVKHEVQAFYQSIAEVPKPLSVAGSQVQERVPKLPKIVIKPFSGEYEDWLPWWNQYEQIHDNEMLNDAEKVQYLVQTMAPGSKVSKLVNSFPLTKTNYKNMVEALTRRYGNKSILIEVYVRKLLKLVISNLRNKKDLTSLYNEMSTSLRSLKSLGVDFEVCGCFLYPLVESCLPGELIELWERDPLSGYGKDEEEINVNQKLINLIKFMDAEVRVRVKVDIAKAGLEDQKESFFKSHKYPIKDRDSLSTAAALYSGKGDSCVFCELSHSSQKCYKAKSMSMEEKQEIVRVKRICFSCLKPGHISKRCKEKIKCTKCNCKHYEIMCTKKITVPDPGQHNEDAVFSGLCFSKEVILQTLMVKLKVGTKERKVRALLDSGAQSSYILDRTVKEMQLVPYTKKSISHEVFGGSEFVKTHCLYEVKVKNIRSSYITKMKLIDSKKICSELPRMNSGPWTTQLKHKRIWLSDIGYGSPEIELLIGADLYAKIVTGNVVKLSNGLTAMETKLGWTVMGNVEHELSIGHYSTLLSLETKSVMDLWNLESLGIKDPVEVKSHEEKNKMALLHENLKKEEDGRYSVGLPWNDEMDLITCNKKQAEQRLNATTKKLKRLGMMEKYNQVFLDWQKEGIIELVPENLTSNGFYLPHHAVVKPESTTTPIRPVFDASCKNGRNQSLNDCLYVGPNLLELIPNVLLRFREKKIGIVADIRKAFQMIGVNIADRDYLRFLWWKIPEMQPIIYRHCRVVFGVNCSPFLLAAVLEVHLSNVDKEFETTAKKIKESFYVDNLATSVDTEDEYVKFKDQAVSIMRQGQFELRQWECTTVGNEDCDQSEPILSDSTTKVLGLIWDRKEDTLSLDIGRN